jgi:hypothetical protein
MPMLTPALLFKLKSIIAQHHTAFVANTYGHDAIPSAVLEDLKKLGLIDPKAKATQDDAYLYGQVLALLEDPKVPKWDAQKVLDYAKKNPIPLTPVEESAKKNARLTAAAYVVGLGNTIDKESGQVLIDADHALREKLQEDIANETAKNIASRKTVKELKTELGHRMQDWTRNLDRIAITEKHNAMTAGLRDGIQKRHGPEARVAIRPAPDACAHCKRLHLGPDGQPRIFKLSQLEAPGFNVKKKPVDWRPSSGAVHPHCGCQMVRVPNGWGFDETGTMVPGGEYGVEQDETEKSFSQVLLEEESHRDLLEKAMHELVARIEFNGLVIAIENASGSIREWKDRNGDSGITLMQYPYGFIEGTMGADGDAIDVYVGPDPNAPRVFIINQRKKLGEGQFGGFDEQKVMLGFQNVSAARTAYLAHYDDPGFLGSMSEMSFEEFKHRVESKQEKIILKGSNQKPLQGPALIIKGNFPEGAESREQDFTATSGAGAVMLPGPARPVNRTDTAGMRYVLTDPGNEQDANKVRKDKEDYLLRDNAGRLSWVYPLEIDPAQMHGEQETFAEENKADAERLILQITDVPRFMPQEGMRPVEAVTKSGEGSRGGHVVGHTADGKPIYERHDDPTILEYAKQNLISGKSKSIAHAAKATVAKLHGGENMMIGPGVSHIDQKKLEGALTHELWEHASPTPWKQPDKPREHMSNAFGTKSTFNLGDKDMAKLEAYKPVEKSRRRSGIPASALLEKAAGHLYTSKTGYAGHWIYTYAEQHGGKVVPHTTDPSQVVVKMPQTPAGTKALTDLKAAHALPGPIFTGGKYTMMAVPTAALPAAQPAAAPKAMPKPVAPPTAPAAVQAAPKALDLSDIPVMPKASLKPPPKAGWQYQAGTTLTIPSSHAGPAGAATVKGWDYRGRFVATDAAGNKRIVPFAAATLVTKAEHVPAFQKLSHPDAVRAPTAEQAQLVDKVLSMKVGGVSGKDMADWLHTRGHEVYLVGGIVRDLISGTDPQNKQSTQDVLDSMNDVDIVSSAPPDTLRKAFAATGAKAPIDSDSFQQKGCVSNGELDTASLSSGGVYDKPVYNSDTGASAVPGVFDHDLEKDAARRDFTANALYYDVANRAIIDPTGTGVADARAKVLRLPPGNEWKQNDKLAIRFWKLRGRGWTADASTTKAMAKQVNSELANMGTNTRVRYIAKSIGKNAPSGKKALADLKALMTGDGAGPAYAKYIAPLESAILAAIKGKG